MASERALLVVDVLQGIFALPEPLHDPDGFIAVVQAMVARARASGTPVVYLQHVGPPGTPFARGTAAREIDARVKPAPGDLVVEKEHPDGFHGTKLAGLLARARELAICGFASEACVDTNVRSAYAHGYRVVLVADGHTTTCNAVLSAPQIIAHHNHVLARFAEVLPHQRVNL